MIAGKPVTKRSRTGQLIGGPAGFRDALLRLGPTFVKLGQFLALRPDLIPQEYCDELMKLLDRVPPFSWQEAKAVLTEDFGRDPKDLFEYINPRPVAAGSLAQVHTARLSDGTEVATKIQRPNIQRLVARDLRRARLLARVLDVSGVTLAVSPRAVVQELGEWLSQEIDFRIEVENMTRLADLSAGDRSQRIPRPFPELCSARVTTTEYLRGVPISEILAARRSGAPDGERRIASLGIDCDQVAANLFTATLTQLFRYRFFHADLHPGNLLALPGNVIGFVDFGLCGHLDETVRQRQFRYMAAVYSDDRERMFDALLEILVPTADTDVDAFRAEFYERTSAWGTARAAARYTITRSVDERSPTGAYLVDVMRAAQRHRLQVPARVLQMYRALLGAEAVATQLGSRLDLSVVARRFFANLEVDEVMKAFQPKNLEPALLNLFTFVRDSPGQLQQALSNLASGRLNVNVEVRETRREQRASNRRARVLAAAIVSVGLATVLSSEMLYRAPSTVLRGVLAAGMLALYVYIFVESRRLR